VATHDDEWRCRYITETLSNVRLAIGDGVDVRGYFHWTNTDNFEWSRGYNMHFGLIGVDRKSLERTIKPSGRIYGRIAASNSLSAVD
jgi:beta-glucosidase